MQRHSTRTARGSGLLQLLVLLAAGGARASSGGEEEPAAPAAPPAPAPRMIIVQPGYPGSTRDAAPYVGRLTAYLAEKAAVPGLSGAYYNLSRQALDGIREGATSPRGRFAFGIVSLGFYLEHRASLKLVPLLEVQPEGRYYLVVPRTPPAGAPRIAGPADLAGKTVVGGALHEEAFIRRVVFGGLVGIASWKTVPTLRISRGLRRLEQGRYGAAILNAREYRSLEKLDRLKSLEIIQESDYYPCALFVFLGASAAGEKTSGGELSLADDRVVAKRVAGALPAMASDPAGKKILETLSCGGFRPYRPPWLQKLEKRYHGEEK